MRAIAAAVAGAVLVWASQGVAATGPWSVEGAARARLIAGASGVAMEIRLAPGWKTYWRAPGEAGLPPSIDLSGSGNAGPAVVSWPLPVRFDALGTDTIGYPHGAVVLPVSVRPVDPEAPMRLRAALSFLICGTMCVPVRLDAALDVAVPAVADPDADRLIAAASAAVPDDGRRSGIRIGAVTVDGEVLVVPVEANPPLRTPDVFVDAPSGWLFGRPSFAHAEGGRGLTARLPIEARGAAAAAAVVVGDGQERGAEAAMRLP